MSKSNSLPSAVQGLIDRFTEHSDAYLSSGGGGYNETQLRREFLDPLFGLQGLGWDIDNTAGYAEAYKDVIHEDAIKVGGATKAPDYCFRIGGVRKFFLEAKKPSVDIKGDPGPAYQLRRYAWSAKLPLSILSDFQEFAVYDCRIKPAKGDKPSVGRVMYFTFDQLAERWDGFAGIFSQQAILKGSFDKYAESTKRKRGTAEVDTAFLEEIELWRDSLARNLALRNDDLNQRDLNFAVQRTIDRIIFLRICEDRGVEQYGTLQGLVNGDHVYDRLFERFRRADERYNSGLFHFDKEKGRPESPDDLTPGLSVDDKTLKDILARLYYPDSPYEFSVLPADILGQVYEQFLGKVIRLTKGHRAVVEEKPEVRKAGGVYYTPTYIVDYIVKHTVGKLVEGKTPQQVAGLTDKWQPSKKRSPITVLDPACGSGSFLLGAYQFLLDWYRDQYINEGPKKHTGGKMPRLYQRQASGSASGGGGGDYRLTTAERKRILTGHIYGVDIDSQAVETTKLSLLLKVLEGENAETLGTNLRLFHERALPDLAQNIKCGNSLIGSDFYDNQQIDMFDEEERLRINVFDWEIEFKDIMGASGGGGFDAVIGNPPYIRIQTMQDTAPETLDYYRHHYAAAIKGNYDIYVLFAERGLGLLGAEGHLGFILPHKFFNAQYGRSLRQHLGKGRHVASVVHFGHQQVFAGATTYTCLLFLDRAPRDFVVFTSVSDLDDWRLIGSGLTGKVPCDRFGIDNWNITVGKHGPLIDRLAALPVRLGDIADRIFQGFKTGADTVFILERGSSDGHYLSKALKTEVNLENIFIRHLNKSGDMKRYCLNKSSRVVIFPYRDGNLIPWKEIEDTAPMTASYLEACHKILDSREKGRFSGSQWYCYSRQQALEVMSSQKILTADINPKANYCFDIDGSACFPGGAAGGYGIVLTKESPLYLLGLLNSRCLDLYARHVATIFRGGWFSYDAKVLRQLPIHVIAPRSRTEKAAHDRIVSLVQSMLDLHKQLADAKTGHGKTAIQRQIDATDRQIDQLVYELYGLSDEEIGIVEEAVGGKV